MKKNGFTLAELLAVITILGVIALIVFPAVNKSIKNSKEKSYNQQVESILRSAENWTLENMVSLSDTNDNYITIGELQQSGYLEAKQVINPITDEEMDGCVIVKYDEAHKQYNYRYVEESCNELDSKILPIITLNGNATITIENGSVFIDPGAIATYKDVDISDNIIVTGEVKNNIAGTYTLHYNVNYDGKDANEVIRTIVVECPTITLMGMNVKTCDTMTNDPDGNLRYVGSDPDNYVWFNKELWRIIGVFGDQMKIIRNDYYSESIAWDSNQTNDWSTASLQQELNGTYLSSIQTNDPTSYSYINQNYIWNMGGIQIDRSVWTRSYVYGKERGEEVVEGRPTTWKGAIGLMYVSDYGYSTSGDATTCGVSMYNWGSYSTCDVQENLVCKNNSWLYDSNKSQWTMTPDSKFAMYSIMIQSCGFIDTSYHTSQTMAVRPVLFLNSNVKIVDGTGTDTDPFILDVE